MGLFSFVKKNKPVGEFNKFKYYPDNIYSLQDSTQSVLNGTGYDITRFSKHEIKIIEMVLSAAERKYKEDYKAIGLANECYPIVYKPRYIVFEVLIQRYLFSEKPLDQIAVAFAYWSKGARFFSDAAKFFEKAKLSVNWNEVHQFSSLSGALSLFSNMYEKIHEYEKSIECLQLSIKYEDLNKDYAQNKINLLKEKQKSWKPYRPRKMSADQEEFEKLVSLVAERYV